MKIKAHLYTLLLSLFVTLILMPASAQNSTEPIITIDGKQVPYKEFKYVYKKNNESRNDAFTKASVQEYLDLYINFKLKVMEAESRGIDTTQAFKTELANYEKQLAEPYLAEREVTQMLIKEAYDRMKQEVKASHILIRLPDLAEPKDTLAAYNKALKLKKEIENGADFGTYALKHSEDPSAQSNKGMLGYFTGLQMVYPFEDAAYKTKVGQISNPIRTRFGYHLIKVHDKRPSQGKVKVAHIMIRGNEGMPKEDSAEAVRKINKIYEMIQKGHPWEDLCKEFSEDDASKARDGELPVFGTGSMIPSFEDASFALANPGDVSKPVRTPYGWHIIKLIEKIELEPFENLEPQIKARVKRDSRSELSHKHLIARLKKENDFKQKKTFEKKILPLADSNLVNGNFEYPKDGKLNKKKLFTITNDYTYIGKDFFDYLQTTQKPRNNVAPAFLMENYYNNFVEEKLVEVEKELLPTKHYDYKMLLSEYRDGILLFQLMDEKVWSKAIKDTTGLIAFFGTNRRNYMWKERADAEIISAKNEELITEFKQMVAAESFPITYIKFENLLFGKNSPVLTADHKATLDNLARNLSRDTNLLARLDVRTSKYERSNTARLRLIAVKNYLLEKLAVNPSQVSFVDLGKSKPLTHHNDQAQQNQSVNIVLQGTHKDQALKQLNKTDALNIKYNEGLYEKADHEVFEQIKWAPGTHKAKMAERFFEVNIKEIQKPTYKELDETRGMVISDYQNYLEQQWIKELRSQHKVEVDEELLKTIIKK